MNIQTLQKKSKVYSDLIQILDFQAYRVVSNIKSLEFDLCTETGFETVLIELKK